MQIETRHTPSFGVARLGLAPGEPVRVESGAMLATSYGVAVASRAEGGLLKSLARAALGGESFSVPTYTAPAEGGFLVHASDTGAVVLSCYGALDVLTLQPGEYVTVDTGHVVAYADGVQSRIRPVSQGMVQSMRSGEGLVFDFAGPGRVLTQTRNPRGLVSWLQSNGLGARS